MSKHKFIVSLYDFSVDGKKIKLLLEFAAKGDYYKYFKKVGHIEEAEAAEAIYQLLLALNYLHEKDIIHRDIKLENILIDQNMTIKLCDFGWCSPPDDPERNLLAGTYEYMAPEVIKRQKYGVKVDIWSLGVLAFELLHQYTPFKGRSTADISGKIIKGEFTLGYHISPKFRDLIQSCLEYNPSSRPSTTSLLQHPVFQTLKNRVYGRKSIRCSVLGMTQMKNSYMPDHSIIYGNKENSPGGGQSSPKLQANLVQSQINYSALDCTLMERLGMGGHRDKDQSDAPLVNARHPTRSRKASDNFDKALPSFGTTTENTVIGPSLLDNMNYPQLHRISQSGIRPSYEPEFDPDFEDKPNFTLGNMNEYVIFDVDIEQIVESVTSGGRAVAGFFGKLIGSLQGFIDGLDQSERKQTPKRSPDKPVQRPRIQREVLEINQANGNQGFKKIENVLKGGPIRQFNIMDSRSSFQFINTNPKPVQETFKEDTRQPLKVSFKNKPLDVGCQSPLLPTKDASIQDDEEEESVFSPILNFFGFSSENDKLKNAIKTQHVQREERKIQAQHRRAQQKANEYFEDYSGPE